MYCDFPDICVTIACILRNPLNTVDIRLREPGRRRGGCVLRHRHSAGQGPIVSLQGVDRPSGISCSSGGKRLGYAGSDSCDSFVGLTAIYIGSGALNVKLRVPGRFGKRHVWE